MLHAVIMAGGAGTRFWPESRAARPKQLMDMTGEGSMIQLTVRRLEPQVPPERTMIVTNAALVGQIQEQLPQVPAVIGEPCKRDTAPCIGLAALLLARDDPDATMAVLPADHVIAPRDEFQRAVGVAARLVDGRGAEGRIVTFGVKPTYPAESFGYIERGEAFETGGDEPAVYRVARFREKPKTERAREFVETGRFYWNSGIFVWKARTILDALRERQPAMVGHLETIVDAWGSDGFDEVFQREFTAIEPISIDYAVMEDADDVLVIEAPFSWDDVGSWQALARLRPADADGNTIACGRHLGLNTRGCIVRGTGDHLIVTLGVEDTIVVQTPDATLVAAKKDEESIRDLVKLIRERGWEEYL